MAPLLATAEVARILAVSRRCVRLWAESGELRGIKMGRQWRFRYEAVHKWLAEREPSRKIYFVGNQAVRTNNGNHGKRVSDLAI
ncbi:MAG: helix-turn-helix domain-containing protein [Bryobacteraceae bacterium]